MSGMRISELAARSGVPASTLRYYEAEGLLPAARAANGYRVYGLAAEERLAFITQAKHLDLALSDVRELVAARESEPCAQVRATYRPMLATRMADVDDRISSLAVLRATLQSAMAELDRLPDRDAPCDAGCSFLEPKATAQAETPVVACTLDGGEGYAERIAAWKDLLSGGTDRVEVPGGVRVLLPIGLVEKAAALAAAEQQCCSFFGFRIELLGKVFTLTITAPEEAADLLSDLLPASASGTGR